MWPIIMSVKVTSETDNVDAVTQMRDIRATCERKKSRHLG